MSKMQRDDVFDGWGEVMDSIILIKFGAALSVIGVFFDIVFYYRHKAINDRLTSWWCHLSDLDMGSKIERSARMAQKVSGWIFGKRLLSNEAFYRAVVLLSLSSLIADYKGVTMPWKQFLILWLVTFIVNFIPGLASFYVTGLMVRSSQWAHKLWFIIAVFAAEVGVLYAIVYAFAAMFGMAVMKMIELFFVANLPARDAVVLSFEYTVIFHLYLEIGFYFSVFLIATHLLLLLFLFLLHVIKMFCAYIERLVAMTVETKKTAPLATIGAALSILVTVINAGVNLIPPIASPSQQLVSTIHSGLYALA